MEWYEDAASKFIEHLDEEYGYSKEILTNIEKSERTYLLFHFDTGMKVRNALRELGFTDNKYGNLDDHYIDVLHIAYRKVGINEYR